jgi:hypothetical protein
MKRITLTIAEDGSVTAEAHGNQGKRCVDDLETINSLVGPALSVHSQFTQEFEEHEVTDVIPQRQEDAL